LLTCSSKSLGSPHAIPKHKDSNIKNYNSACCFLWNETWSLTLRNECRGSGFSRNRMLKRILESKREEERGDWRKWLGVTKLRRVRCVGHMALKERVWRKHHLVRLCVYAGIILKGIRKNIKGVFGLDSCDPGYVKWQVLLNMVINIHVPWNVGGEGIWHKILASQWEICYIELIYHRMYLRQYARRDGDSAGGGSLFIILLPSAVINVSHSAVSFVRNFVVLTGQNLYYYDNLLWFKLYLLMIEYV
jgi:hypothetical protein